MPDGMSGTDILLLVNTGTNNSPTWTEVGSQRDANFDESNSEIDYSSKTTGRAKIVDYGRYSSSISMDALYVPDDAGYLALKAACRDGDLIKVRREESGSVVEESEAVISKMGTKAPDSKEATLSIDLTLSGGWTEVGS